MFGFPVSQLSILVCACFCCCWLKWSRLSLLTSAFFSSISAAKTCRNKIFSLKETIKQYEKRQRHKHSEEDVGRSSHRLWGFCCWCKPTSAGSNFFAPVVRNVGGFYKVQLEEIVLIFEPACTQRTKDRRSWRIYIKKIYNFEDIMFIYNQEVNYL